MAPCAEVATKDRRVRGRGERREILYPIRVGELREEIEINHLGVGEEADDLAGDGLLASRLRPLNEVFVAGHVEGAVEGPEAVALVADRAVGAHDCGARASER